MKRVDWPDEEGWWWVIEKDVDRITPHRFIQGYGGELVTSYGLGKHSWLTSPVFEGPISEPGTKLAPGFKITITGAISEISPSPFAWDIDWLVISTRNKLVGKKVYDKQFRITFEEMLCEG